MRLIVAVVMLAWATAGFAQSTSDEQLTALREVLREATEVLKRTQTELAYANSRLMEIEKRLADTESALSKEKGEPASNIVQGIKIKMLDSWRNANGTIYIGVKEVTPLAALCDVTASSDKVDFADGLLYVSEAIKIETSQGKYRIVVTTLDKDSCTFDLVKD